MKKEIRWVLEEKYGGVKTDEFQKDIKELQNGEPVDYVIGFVDFLECKIDLSSRPFIPRHETEFWTQKAIEDIKQNPKEQIRVLDIFAGSGCIGIAVLKHDRRVRCDFADVRETFPKQIRKNAKINQIDSRRFRVLKSDIFSAINDRYDYILANPPYVATDDFLDPKVRQYEPHEAVLAGPDGLKLIKKFLKTARHHLEPQGKIYLEFGAGQKDQVIKTLAQNSYYRWEFKKDQFNTPRYAIISPYATAKI